MEDSIRVASQITTNVFLVMPTCTSHSYEELMVTVLSYSPMDHGFNGYFLIVPQILVLMVTFLLILIVMVVFLSFHRSWF